MIYKETTDIELLRRIGEGDETSKSLFYVKWEEWALSVAKKLKFAFVFEKIQNEKFAQEIVHESFLKFFSANGRTFDYLTNDFKPYMKQIIYTTGIDLSKKYVRTQKEKDGTFNQIEESLDISVHNIGSEDRSSNINQDSWEQYAVNTSEIYENRFFARKLYIQTNGDFEQLEEGGLKQPLNLLEGIYYERSTIDLLKRWDIWCTVASE